MFIFASNKEIVTYVVTTFFLPVRAPGATIDGVNAVIIEGGAIESKVAIINLPGSILGDQDFSLWCKIRYQCTRV